jgi:hypothetical protein
MQRFLNRIYRIRSKDKNGFIEFSGFDFVNPVNPVHFLFFIGVYRRLSAFIGVYAVSFNFAPLISWSSIGNISHGSSGSTT